MTRKATNKLLQLIEDGCIDRDSIILACLKYMSEDEVTDMCRINDIVDDDDDDEEENTDE